MTDKVEEKLFREHDDEAARLGVEFTNWGWGTTESGIASKTSKGILESNIDPNTMQVSHCWTTYEEKARNQERFQRECVEHFGQNLRDHVVRQLAPIRSVYGDLPEFAPIWEAIDKLAVN